MTEPGDGQVLELDPLYGTGGCLLSPRCEKYVEQYSRRLVGKYIGVDGVDRKQMESAVLDLRGLTFEAFSAAVKKTNKGAALRQARKSADAGLVVHRFEWSNHVPDIVEINQSKEIRSGGAMTAAYRRDVDDMGGPPQSLKPLREDGCTKHWVQSWGVFEPKPGHQNGEVVTDEKLVAYIKVKRQGDMAIYTTILGHGDYLRLGVMYRLHFAIVEWLADAENELAVGLDYLLYGAAESGTPGLQLWKKNAQFSNAHLVVPSAKLPQAAQVTP